jgi:hypothetical protein
LSIIYSYDCLSFHNIIFVSKYSYRQFQDATFRLPRRMLRFIAAWISLIANTSTIVTASCVLSTFFFNQTLDHDLNSTYPSAGDGTFQQQYQLNTTYFRPDGPILFVQSGEGPIACAESTIFWDWAKEMGAIVASIEHRYFGLSLPDGFNSSTASPSQYAYLTMNNTLLDSVNFVDWIKNTVPGAKNSKVITIGSR